MDLEREIRRVLEDDKLPCALAFKVVDQTGASPGEIGDLANKLNIRISYCQLGLFGYGPKSEGRHKVVKPAETVAPDLAALLQHRAKQGEITCREVWAVADILGITRMRAAAAAETLGLHIVQCQLHCF